MCSIDAILTHFEEKDVSALLIVTSMMSAASVVISIATFIVTIVNLKGSHPQVESVEVQNSEAAEVHLEEAHVEEAEDTHSEDVESDDSQAIEPQEQLYRLSVPSGNEFAVKRKGPHMGIGLVEAGNGQMFRVITLTSGTFAGSIQVQAVGGVADGKVLDNYKQKNDRLCFYKNSRDNNHAQNWKRYGNKLISTVRGKLAVKVNGESIGFSENGDDITFIPV